LLRDFSYSGVIIPAPPLDSGFRRNGLEKTLDSGFRRNGAIEKPEWIEKNEITLGPGAKGIITLFNLV
jgi:hypothetical protein